MESGQQVISTSYARLHIRKVWPKLRHDDFLTPWAFLVYPLVVSLDQLTYVDIVLAFVPTVQDTR